MKKSIVFILTMAILWVCSGCATKGQQTLKGIEKKNAEEWLKSANLLYRVGEYGDAVEYYEKIIENYPDTIYAATAEKKLKNAQKYYLKSIKKN